MSIDIDSTPRECSSYCSFLDALCSPLFSSVRAETPTVLPYFYRGWLTSVLACIDNGILCLLPGEKRCLEAVSYRRPEPIMRGREEAMVRLRPGAAADLAGVLQGLPTRPALASECR